MDFAKQKTQRLAELERSFLLAMRESRFADALRFAQTVKELEPSNTKYNAFIPLLVEKLALEETTSSEEEEGEPASTNGAVAGGPAAEGEEEGDDDDDDEDDDDDDDDEEEDEDEEGEEGTEAGTSEANGGADESPEVEAITLDAANLRLTKQERSKMRESLRKSIKDLKEKELAEKLKSSDPLLGA